MKYFKRVFLAALIATPATLMASPRLEVEAPTANAVQSGITQIYGWVTDTVKVTSVTMTIDNNPATTIELAMGGERSDVASAYPDDFAPLKSGFSTAFHSKLLSNGLHLITILATNEDGQTTTHTRNFIISNTPEAAIFTDSVDLSGASARFDERHIFIDGMKINGRVYQNFSLSYDDVTNGFRISAFREDLDNDGFHDDNVDRDGFHDDDADRDGFHDDDADRDGFHDDDLDHDGFHDDIDGVTGATDTR